MKRLAAMFLSLAMLITFLAGCEGKWDFSQTVGQSNMQSCEKSQAKNLMQNIQTQNVNGKNEDEKFIYAMTNFSLEIFKQLANNSENALVSPLSIINCLVLVQNGADKDTLKQFEDTFKLDRHDMNLYLKSFNERLDKTKSVMQANSIWLDSSRFTPKQKFLQINADYFNADIMSSDFNNPNTVNNINLWVKENTNNMIDEIVEKITPDTVMYLINALTFSADWEEPYNDYQVIEGDFYSQGSKIQQADYLSCTVYEYLEFKNAKGFKKQYKNRNLSFVAILPDENIDVIDFLKDLDANTFINTVNNPINLGVTTQLPAFKAESDFSDEIIESLTHLGIKDVFKPDRANLYSMGESASGENIFVANIIHRTYFELTQNGTRAGAASAAVIYDTCVPNAEMIEISLTRPFAYAIVDNQTGLPIFMGTVLSL